jgi:hypothetical protein
VFEVDHLFVFTDAGAPEADRLVAFGLTEGEPNVHPGQGTANRRFFFRNVFLELLWVSDPEEARSELVRPMHFWQRWTGRRSGASSPFGVLLRPARPSVEGLPFPCWEYRPPYLPAPLAIHVAQGVPPEGTYWAYLPFGRRPDAPDRPRRQPMEHAAGFREVTQVRFIGPRAGDPPAAAGVAQEAGPEHLMELTFDGGERGGRADFRPVLPIIFRW